MIGLISSFMGLSSSMRIVIYAGLGAVALIAAVGWLRWDATQDERLRAAAAGNAAVIDVLKEKNEIEERIDNESDDHIRSLLGIPSSSLLDSSSGAE